MKQITNYLLFFVVMIIIVSSCRKNFTKYYPDPQNPGISAFTNKNYNIAAAYINGAAWRTVDRRTSGFASTVKIFEVDIRRQVTSTSADSIIFTWPGFYQNGNNINSPEVTISAVFPVSKNFSYKDFSIFHKQRFTLNINNGHFNVKGSTLSSNLKLQGNIYFHEFILDSTGINRYSGKMSGLFEAFFPGVQITKGRFDHLLDPEIVQL